MNIFKISYGGVFYKNILHEKNSFVDLNNDLTKLMNDNLKSFLKERIYRPSGDKLSLFDFILPKLEKLGYEILNAEEIDLQYIKYNKENNDIMNRLNSD
jgi:hypothetical protein